MSFVKQQIHLPGGIKQPVHQPKVCTKCSELRIPEGGIEMGPGRWICAACWAKRAMVRRK